MDEIHEETGKFPESNDLPGIDDRLVEVIFTGTRIQNTEYKMVRIDIWEQIQEELKTLREHRDSTVGLWASDQSYEATINKATHDGFNSIYSFATDNEKSLANQIISDIEQEFKKVTFQIK